MKEQRKKRSWLTIVYALGGAVVLVGLYVAYTVYTGFFKGNVSDKQNYLYIYSDWEYEDVLKSLRDQEILLNEKSFRWAAEQKDYPTRVKPGRYKLQEGMNNRTLLNMLGAGLQEPVRIRFENIRLREEFAAKIAEQLEVDSLSIMNILNDSNLADSLGFTDQNFFSLFIPNTYEFYWNTSAEQFLARMQTEYGRFWNEDRRAKAANLGLSPQEVSVLASIVKGEALHIDEMPKIAGLYLNRLRIGMPLQADPTVIFANQDFSIRRVLYKHLTIDSPYNTYKYKGLPPGPIMMPSIQSIDAVLNFDKHNYIYMCAKDDFSGYHLFAENLAEHNRNARKFQQALNERNIKR
jgi:UPF0755 protein